VFKSVQQAKVKDRGLVETMAQRSLSNVWSRRKYLHETLFIFVIGGILTHLSGPNFKPGSML
jgi:hypothetical protein